MIRFNKKSTNYCHSYGGCTLCCCCRIIIRILFLLIGISFVIIQLYILSFINLDDTNNNNNNGGSYNNNNNRNQFLSRNKQHYRQHQRILKKQQQIEKWINNKRQQHQQQQRQQQQQQQQEEEGNNNNNPDAIFNGVPVFYTTRKKDDIISHVHCVGNTYDDMFFTTNDNNNNKKSNKKKQQQQQQQQDDEPGNWDEAQRLLYSISNSLSSVQNHDTTSNDSTTTADDNEELSTSSSDTTTNNNKYQSQSWKYRSCYYSGLFCFNMSSQNYIVYQSKHDRIFQHKYLQYRPYFDTSSSTIFVRNDLKAEPLQQPTPPEELHTNGKRTVLNTDTISVSIGGINQKWNMNGIQRLKWSPVIIPYDQASTTDQLSYYELPPHIVMIPYHSLNGANPGHLVWDDFLPMYNLLSMFQLLNNNDDNSNDDDNNESIIYEILPMRYVLPTTSKTMNNQQDSSSSTTTTTTNTESRGLWASCDFRPDKKELCQKMITKFQQLLVGTDYPYNWTTTQSFVFQQYNDGLRTDPDDEKFPKKSDLICSKHGVAGIGPLTDHGIYKSHGWESNDYTTLHNAGRGPLLYEFRNFMIQNLQLPKQRHRYNQRPYRVIFSQRSSDIPIRDLMFEEQIKVVQESFASDKIQVENYTMKELSIQEQITIVQSAAIYISLCGGGAVTGMFVPKGASIILYYNEDGGLNSRNGKVNYMPALLDYDLFTSLSYARVHWLPRSTMNTYRDLQSLVALIQHEIEIIEEQEQKQSIK